MRIKFKTTMEMIAISITLILLMLNTSTVLAQIENVPVTNPVYDFLLRIETKGILPNYSLTKIPWQTHTVISALKLARQNDSLLSDNEKQILLEFEKEFGIVSIAHAVLFYSDTDTIQVISKNMFGDYEKSFYHYKDSNSNVTVKPLASIEYIQDFTNNRPLLLGTIGFRTFGTLTNSIGYYLQLTNTAKLQGEPSLALRDSKYSNNLKFSKLHSDADIAESHVAYQNQWFYASIGRQTTLFGSGLNQRLYINNLAPAFDAVTIAAKFRTFEYSFSHNSLINIPISKEETGFNAVIPSKYVAMHNFTFKPSWGEISFFESVIYSRDLDLAYLNPLSFLKSLEHAQQDRDNSNMGLNAVYRPFKNFQIKGTWFIDDVKFSEIGEKFWSNKTAWNIAVISSAIKNIDIGLEYSRVEPYTFSHFNPQNSNTNNSVLFASSILPNSDRWNLLLQYWFGERYPIKLNLYYTRHGKNIYDTAGNLIFNAGGDPLQSIRWTEQFHDPTTVDFLGGELVKTINLELTAGFEIIKGFNIQLLYNLQHENNTFLNYGKVILRFCDF